MDRSKHRLGDELLKRDGFDTIWRFENPKIILKRS
jgi:hypothetical protein